VSVSTLEWANDNLIQENATEDHQDNECHRTVTVSPIEKIREFISDDWNRTIQMSPRCSTERTGMKIPLMQSPGWTSARLFVVVMALVYTS
jgi:hypothetical protein